ncbi:MAG: DNA alkylation repair protein, partial [Actinomycetota bacterium]
DHPNRVVSLLETWHAEGVDETTWIVRHALRNHLKAGDPRVMTLFGYAIPEVDVVDLRLEPANVRIGDAASVAFDLTSTLDRPQDLHVDLVIGYTKANGKRSPKVFKYRTFELDAGQTEGCSKKLSFVHRSTRKLYPGEHTVTVRVNGSDLATASFDVTT